MRKNVVFQSNRLRSSVARPRSRIPSHTTAAIPITMQIVPPSQ